MTTVKDIQTKNCNHSKAEAISKGSGKLSKSEQTNAQIPQHQNFRAFSSKSCSSTKSFWNHLLSDFRTERNKLLEKNQKIKTQRSWILGRKNIFASFIIFVFVDSNISQNNSSCNNNTKTTTATTTTATTTTVATTTTTAAYEIWQLCIYPY